MSLRFSSFGTCIALMMLGMGALVLGARGAEQPSGQASGNLGEAKSMGVRTNPPLSIGRKDGLMQLEEELSRSLQVFKSRPSLEGVPAPTPARPQPAPAVPNRRSKEQADRRKNWAFANPGDLPGGLTLEEMFNIPGYGPDGQEKKSMSTMERFYESLDRKFSNPFMGKRSETDDPLNPRKEKETGKDGDKSEEANTPSGVRETEMSLRKLLGTSRANLAADPARGSLLDIFGLGTKTPSVEQELAHKEYMKQYQQWLGSPLGVPGSDLVNVPGAPEVSSRPVTPGLGSGYYNSLGRPDATLAPLDLANSPPSVGTLPDVSTKALNQWNPMYTPPKVEPPKPSPPPSMPDVPRRKF